jgi:hypothetical protein
LPTLSEFAEPGRRCPARLPHRLFLAWRWSGRLGLAVGCGSFRGLHLLDTQIRHVGALRLLDHVTGDLILHLVKRRKLFLALVEDLDDVPAEWRFHRVGDLADLEPEGFIGEFRWDSRFGNSSNSTDAAS